MISDEEYFERIVARYEEVAIALAQPETIADQPLFQSLMREMAELEPQVSAWKAYRDLKQQEADARELLGIPEMHEMAREELSKLEEALARQEEALQLMLLPRDEDDQRDVVMEVARARRRGGRPVRRCWCACTALCRAFRL